MRVPAALAAIPLVLGAVAGILLVDRVTQEWALMTAVAAGLALAAAAEGVSDGCAPETTAAIVVGVTCAGFSLGLSAARDAYRDVGVDQDNPIVVEGRLREDAVVSETGVSLTLDVAKAAPAGEDPRSIPRRFGARIAVGGAGGASRAGQWRGGRVVRVTATLRPPSTYRNFGVPDEARALARRGIALVGTAKSAALVEVIRRGGYLDEAAASARAWARARLARFVGHWSARSAAIAAAILIGDRSGITDEDERRLQIAGTYHVIAISGGNIAILTALLLFALRWLFVPGRAAATVVIATLLFYGLLTGAPPSVARAITAAIAYLSARAIDHRGPPLNAVAVAAIGALMVSPVAALDPGFILSFGATIGILLGAPRLIAPPQAVRQPAWRRLIRSFALAVVALFAATVCAEAALIPAGAVLFSRVTFAGLLLNFAAIPLMSIVQATAIVTLAAADAAPRCAALAGYAAHLSTAGLVESARLVDVAPWLSIDVLPPAWWIIGAYYAACVLLLFVRRLRRIALGAALAMTVLILVSPSWSQRTHAASAGLMRVTFLDVGQGDSTVIELPDGRSLLVDAGGLAATTFDIGERVVAPALRALGVRRLEGLAITHGDPDHAGGAVGVTRLLRPHEVWEGIPVPPNAILGRLATEASAQGAMWRTVQAGDADRIAAVDVRIHHPPLPDWERQRVRNDDSIVLEARIGAVSFLLTGDIGREVEQKLIPNLQLAPIVILKAPHHGSITSSSEAFIRAIKPAAVIFSCGRRNPFGHPHPVVVSRYEAAGVPIFRTDRDGAVMVETDGRHVSVRTYSNQRVALTR